MTSPAPNTLVPNPEPDREWPAKHWDKWPFSTSMPQLQAVREHLRLEERQFL